MGWLLFMLLAQVATAQSGLVATPSRLYDNDAAGGAPGPARKVVVRNTGTAAITIDAVALQGQNADQFQLPLPANMPRTLNANDTLQLSVAFNPGGTGLRQAAIQVKSGSTTALTIPLRGLGTGTTSATAEPSLQALLNLLEIPVGVGDDNPATTVINSSASLQSAALLGEELAFPLFRKAGSGAITIEPLAVFGPSNTNPVVGFGWYDAGKRNNRKELFTVGNQPAGNAKTVNVAINGVTTFDPVDTVFGFYSRWPFFQNRLMYSEDSLNTFSGAIPHHVRVFPYRKDGVRVPNAYLVTFEDHITGFDYQDLVVVVRNVVPATTGTTLVLQPQADAYVHRGRATTNLGRDTTLQVQGSSQVSPNRNAYLSFNIQGAKDIRSATLRLFGSNRSSTQTVPLVVKALSRATWVEDSITFNNAPAGTTTLGTLRVGPEAKYYDLDVTAYVQEQFARGLEAGFQLTDTALMRQLVSFHSRERGVNTPILVLGTSATPPINNAELFVENLDGFPSNDRFVTARLQTPWHRPGGPYNANHDMVRVRIHNKGSVPLVVRGVELSDTNRYQYRTLSGQPFDTTAFPISINPGAATDLSLQFVASYPLETRRVWQLEDTLVIVSNDENEPRKRLRLLGLWQREGEGSKEPTAAETIRAFGFKTNVGFSGTDRDKGDTTKLKGNELLSPFFVRADTTKPVTVRQMSAYHGCCTQTEAFRWYPKNDYTQQKVAVSHIGLDAQTLLPRRSSAGAPAEGSFSPSGPFGIKVGSRDHTDPMRNPGKAIGIRVWRAIDADGKVIPDAYIMANDYLGTEFTNFDYNDNMYFVTNVRPERGPASHSPLVSTPSAVDFGERRVRVDSTFNLTLQSLGKTYPNGSADPNITISSVAITGENRGEFVATMPAKATLLPGESTTLSITFKPQREGLKIADLLVYYNNSRSPYRVPLYGIAKDSGTTVNVHYRIKGGSAKAMVINGRTWSPDTEYAFDNLEPYANPSVTQITATDEDSLYFVEQSSNGDKRPFRYQLPLDSGDYVVRMHFAEVYWGVPGSGLSGGAGSRVMGVTMEGQQKLVNLDIVKEVGTAAALVRNVPVKVTDGKLNISYTASVNRPSVSAVEVYSFSRITPPPTDTLPPVDTTVVNPPPPQDTTVVTPPPPPPPVDTTVVPPPPVDTTVVNPPPTQDTTVVTPPPPVDTTVVTPPPPVDTTVVTPPPPTDTVTVPPPPPPVDTVVVTPPVDTTVTPPPPVQLRLYPNPGTGIYTVSFALTRRQTIRIHVTDMAGRRYGEYRHVGDPGNNIRVVDLTNLRLKSGTYLMELYYDEKQRDVLKFVHK